MLVNIPVGGIVDVQHRPPVLLNFLNGQPDTFLIGADGGMSLEQLRRFLLHDGFDQGGNIAEMIIEGIAVDAAVLHDVLDGDLIDGALVYQLPKRLLNGFPGERGHRESAPFAIHRPPQVRGKKYSERKSIPMEYNKFRHFSQWSLCLP